MMLNSPHLFVQSQTPVSTSRGTTEQLQSSHHQINKSDDCYDDFERRFAKLSNDMDVIKTMQTMSLLNNAGQPQVSPQTTSTPLRSEYRSFESRPNRNYAGKAKYVPVSRSKFPPPRDQPASHRLCYYHSIYGMNASKCRPNCILWSNEHQQLRAQSITYRGRRPASKRKTFTIKDKNNNLSFLVDSGSDVSIVPAWFAKCFYNKKSVYLYGAAGKGFTSFGETRVSVNFNLSRSFRWRFLVCAVRQPILGADFLRHYNLLIDIRRRKLISQSNKNTVKSPSLPKRKRPIYKPNGLDPENYHLLLLTLSLKKMSKKTVNDLQTPALIVYQHVVEENCNRMIQLAQSSGVTLRPHFKTTKCLQAAIMQTNGTKRCMVVSTLPEAELLLENGFDDILYGVPLSVKKVQRCKELSHKMELFSVMIDDIHVAKMLQNYPLDNGKMWSVMLKVCCENGRAGMPYDTQQVIETVKLLADSNCMRLKGLYAHCGETYHCNEVKEVQGIANKTTSKLLEVVEKLKANGLECLEYGIGCTPTCSNPTSSMSQLTEWHPGNYVLYDQMQMIIGSCQQADIGCFVLTTVIGHYPDEKRNYMIVDCGFTALSLHGGGDCCGKTPGSGYGFIVNHPELKLASMSQEHGIVKSKNPTKAIDFSKYPLGYQLRIFPDHSCATCCMHEVFHIADKNDNIIDEWVPVKGW
uniref:D-serine dehydratase n=1 Tax=Phallusia mammillata TaxID=59560 RepID=A0A6F9DTW2_9ASCI|nr:D-serine dehydratase-like [Phallusia mammillata]